VIRAAAVLEDREVSYAHLSAIKYALCTMGASEEGAREQRILEEIIHDALPQTKHLAAETRTYDSLGALANQMAAASGEARPNPERRFMFSLDGIKNTRFVWLSELESYMAEMTGRVSFHSARALANDLKRQASILVSRSKKS
jgi:hypothetical protein